LRPVRNHDTAHKLNSILHIGIAVGNDIKTAEAPTSESKTFRASRAQFAKLIQYVLLAREAERVSGKGKAHIKFNAHQV
jgi:hypothetical protein